MLKKRYLAIAGLAVLAIAASGCGKKNTKEQTPVQVTPTETPQATPTVTIELVNMEETTEKNVIGEKTATASKVAIVNRTGSEIASIYIRETPSDDADEDTADEWGDDLVNGMFTLKNGENAVYYYEKPSSSGSTYDIRIAYTDEDANECFFRKLPLASMKQITLRMDGEGEDSIPYATYFTTTGSKEVSTLNEVKKRLGLDTDSEEDVTPTPDPSDSADPTQAPDDSDNTADPTQAPDPDDNNNNSNNNGSTEKPDDSNTNAPTYYADGSYTVTVKCEPDESEDFDAYNLTATITVKGDKITAISNVSGDGDSSNDRYINWAANGRSNNVGIISQIIGLATIDMSKENAETTMNEAIANVDVVSRATCSSQALKDACKEALNQARAKFLEQKDDQKNLADVKMPDGTDETGNADTELTDPENDPQEAAQEQLLETE